MTPNNIGENVDATAATPVDAVKVSGGGHDAVQSGRTNQASPLTKTKQRVADHGEVFTPDWLVEEMLDLVDHETRRIDSRFLEPACGSGNFLVKILQRKLGAVEKKYAKADFERRNYALLAVMCTYGVELLADNIGECRRNLLELFADYLKISDSDDLFWAAHHVLSVNLVHGDAMKMKNPDGSFITFAEWGYLRNGKFQRRDFQMFQLAQSLSYKAPGAIPYSDDREELFPPHKTYEPMTVADLAACAERSAG